MVCHCAVHSLDVADLVPWALWLTSTRDLSTKLIDYLRLQALNNHMFATVSTSAWRQLVSAYRNQNVTYWNDTELEEAHAITEAECCKSGS